MSLPEFNPEGLMARLAGLGSRGQLAFGAACCERLVPSYQAFSEDAGWGDGGMVRRALERIWRHLAGDSLAATEAMMLSADTEAMVPHADDFDSLYVSAAQDACFAICALYDFVLEASASHIVDVARFATDSVDLYVQEIEQMDPRDPLLEDKILAHHLMQRELAQQQQDIDAIAVAGTIDSTFLASLRTAWPWPHKGNLGLP